MGDLADTAAAVLRPVAELAVETAKLGAAARPPVEVPLGLRPLLRFRHLPEAACRAALRVVDTDTDFRQRLVERADEDDLGPAGWLYVVRPDGWHEAVSAAVEAEAEAVAGVVADLEFRLATASEQAAQLTTERDLAEAAARDAVARRQRAETDLAVARTDLGRLRKELQAASGDAAALRTTIEQLGAELDAARNRSAGLDAALTAAEDELAELRARTAAGVDRALAEQVDAVAAQARELARALEVAAAALDPTEPVTAPARSPEPRRRPAELPPGLHDDSLEVAAHLLRVPGMVVLIDGYNLSHVRWADLDPAEQRARLVAALEALAARTGADLEVVFDGADVGLPAAAHQRRSHVRVRFSPAGVEADDVVIDAVDRVSSRRPVTVVSSDRRVRDGARARGARVVGSERFAELLTH